MNDLLALFIIAVITCGVAQVVRTVLRCRLLRYFKRAGRYISWDRLLSRADQGVLIIARCHPTGWKFWWKDEHKANADQLPSVDDAVATLPPWRLRTVRRIRRVCPQMRIHVDRTYWADSTWIE